MGIETAIRDRRFRLVLALAFGVALAASFLGAVEGLLAILHPDVFEAALQRAAERGQPLDRRPRLEVVWSLRERGSDVVPRLVPAALLEEGADGALRSRIQIFGEELLPLAGVASTTTVLCTESGPYAIFESDPHGFRNPASIWKRSPVDLLLLGDSFTLGECVEEGDTIADGLRHRWPSTANLGYSGNSPLFELATLIEYGAVLAPRTTLWIYFENDLAGFDLRRSSQSPLLLRYLEPGFSQGLLDRQEAIDAALRGLVDEHIAQPDDMSPTLRFEAARKGRLARLAEIATLRRTRLWLAGRIGREPESSPAADLELFERVLVRALGEVDRWNGRLVFVFVPGSWNFESSGLPPSWAGERLRNSVFERVASLNIPIVDLHAAMASHPAPLSLYAYPGYTVLGPSHLNAAGYAFVADTIRRSLEIGVGAAGRPSATSPAALPADWTTAD